MLGASLPTRPAVVRLDARRGSDSAAARSGSWLTCLHRLPAGCSSATGVRRPPTPPAGCSTDLAVRFGRGQIFKDIDSIELGDDFVEAITTAVGSCDVLLALIGKQWLTITDEHGTARLDEPDDFVRLELEAALTRKVRVIPILVAGARMPRPDQLPPSLAKLARRQALELSPDHFEFDASRLHKVLDRALADAHAQPTIPEPDVAVVPQQAQLRALYVEARAATRLGHFQTAIALLDDLLALDPSHQDAAHLRAAASQQLHLADTYQRALDAEAAGEWAAAANAYGEVLDIDATYRDAAARRDACQARQQLIDLQGELRGHAAAGQWQAVLDVNAELGRLDPAATDPDGLATQAQHAIDRKKRADDLAHRYTRARNAEDSHEWALAVSEYAAILSIDPAYRDAAARREAGQARQQLLDLQGELRHHAAAGQWQAVLDVDAELGRLDPAATDPDGLATQAQQAIDDEKRADDLAHRYTRARNAEDSHEWAVAVSEYAAILQLDPHYRDTAARQDRCVRMQRINEVSAPLDHQVANEESANVRETFDELTALDRGGTTNYTEFANRARLESAAPQVPNRRRALTTAAGAAAAVCVLLAGLLIWHPWSSGGSAGSTGSVTPSSASPTITHPISPLPSIRSGLEGAGAVSFHNQFWVVGGNAATADHHPLELVQIFDPARGVWTRGPPLPGPVGEAGVVSDGKSVYVIGGARGAHGSSDILATVYRLDSSQGPWILEQPLPQGRVSGAVAFDGTRIVFAGGVGTDGKSHREVFALTGGSWQQIASLTQPRDNFGAASDGKGAVWSSAEPIRTARISCVRSCDCAAARSSQMAACSSACGLPPWSPGPAPGCA